MQRRRHDGLQRYGIITLLSQSVVESSKVRSVSSPSDMSNAVEPPSEDKPPHPEHQNLCTVFCWANVVVVIFEKKQEFRLFDVKWPA